MRLVTMPMSFLRWERWPGVAVDMAIKFLILDFGFSIWCRGCGAQADDPKSAIENRKWD
jgi:hypothetical protein